MTRLPELIQDLRAAASQEDDGSQAQVVELEELTRTIPKLIGLLPAMVRDQADVRQNVAVATMISGLTRQLDNALPLALVSWALYRARVSSSLPFADAPPQSPKQLRGLPVDETTKLHHARSIVYSQFLKTLEAT
jgi:nuclear pore complex protein Nup98-Nup96